jgi:uncharacterized protein YaaQ
MKKVGIVADDYKVSKFKLELTKNGFTDFQTHPFTKGNTSIIVMVTDDKVNDVYRIMQACRIAF